MASKSARKRRKRRPPPPEVRSATPVEEPAAEPPRPVRTRRRGEPEPAPPAPWGNFPLIELSVLIGIVMLVIGLFFSSGSRGPIFIVTGLILGSIGGLELSIREHFAGYRS